MNAKYPDLVEYLKNAKVSVSGNEIPAYHWVQIHTSVEKDHFEHALHAANLAMRYYVGFRDKKEVRKDILNGISSFASMQEEFMKTLEKSK